MDNSDDDDILNNSDEDDILNNNDDDDILNNSDDDDILTNLTLATSTASPAIGSSPRILRPGKTEDIKPPYDWATKRRATVQSMQYLIGKGINSIKGKVQCKRCDRQFEIKYDLQTKFSEVAGFIVKNWVGMHRRAARQWMHPKLPNCNICGQSNCVKPVTEKKKRSINWLFLFLGQMLGICKLSELKYFCKHTKHHRTGAKDRVLYLTFLELFNQLDPQGSLHL